MFKFSDHSTAAYLAPVLDFLQSRLNEAAIEHIAGCNCTLLMSIAPGSLHQINNIPAGPLIIIDQTLTMKLLKFDSTEIAAEILHELGHLFNGPPAGMGPEEKEYYADDFARRYGLGLQLKTGIRKYLKVISDYTDEDSGRYFFANAASQKQIVDLFNRRIARIDDQAPLLVKPQAERQK